MRDIIDLPHDLFILVISFLSPRICIRCRAVNRRWHAAFTSDFVSQYLLRCNFPRCRELRMAAAVSRPALSSSSSSPPPPAVLPRNPRAEPVRFAEKPGSWSAIFAEVARRYHHLNKGQPRLVEKLDLAASRESGSAFSFWGVAPWSRFLRLNEKTSDFHYPDPTWWYSQEDGILVYPAAVDDSDGAPAGRALGNIYHLADLATGDRVSVPFDVRSKHIRRVRLAQGVLIFEWAETLPYHQLNDRELVHRHFVTAFDVIRRPSPAAAGCLWAVEFRCEWKLHFLGLPLNRSDRFFSAHTATHYAVYFWQPTRSLYQDGPIEQLAVWDISSPSPYRPSEDPTGCKRPGLARESSSPPTGFSSQQDTAAATGPIHGLTRPGADPKTSPKRASLGAATAGPQVIRRMAWRDLDFYGLRQRATPRLRSLALDSQNLYVIEEEHRWADGQHSSLVPPRAHFVRSTGIPVIPNPGASAQETRPITSQPASDLRPMVLRRNASLPALSSIIDGPVNGPVWVDSCGANGNVNMNFCQRAAMANAAAATGTGYEVWLPPPPRSGEGDAEGRRQPLSALDSAGWPWAFSGTDSSESVGPTLPARWPGWAPCWRHEDFPYLTVAEMVDFAAGVRITARRCFMLETLSVHTRPAVAVRGATSPTADDDGANTTRRRSRNAKAAPTRSKEVSLPENMWAELLAKGHIAGDERWVVGEDEAGRITVVRF